MGMLSQTTDFGYPDRKNFERIADSLEKISAVLNTMHLHECYKDYYAMLEDEEEYTKAEEARMKLVKSIIDKAGGLTKNV